MKSPSQDNAPNKSSPKSGEAIFGHQNLIPPDGPKNLAPIKRVLMTSESFLPKVDGVSKTSYITARYLQETGRELLIVAPDHTVDTFGPSKVRHVKSMTVKNADEMRIGLPAPSLIKHIKDFQPDLIHMASPGMFPLFGSIYGSIKHIPMIATYQTDMMSYVQQYGFAFIKQIVDGWSRFTHNRCKVNLVPSKTWQKILTERGYKRVQVWQHGIDLERFNPKHRSRKMRESLLAGRSADALLCVYVGRLAPEKSVEILKGVATLPGVALTIVGDGDERSRLQQHFEGTDTHFTGYLYKDELAAAYASADIFLHTGPFETFGLAVQEAMASGLPVVVTNRGGAKDLVIHNHTGLVVSHQASAFSEAIKTFLTNKNQKESMGSAGRIEVESRPWWYIMQELEAHYRTAMNSE